MGTGLKSKGRSAGPSGLSLLLLALSAALVYAKDPDPKRWESAIKDFAEADAKAMPPAKANLFVGSSSIAGWRSLAADFPEAEVINRGFGGSHFSDLNHYVKELVLKYQPAQIFVYEGDNDINAGKTPARVAEDFATFVKVVHKALPKTKITFISIKPSKSRWKLWPKMREANEQIKRSCKGHDWLRVVDVGSAMLNERGEPKDEIFVEDGLHMNKAGYKIWAEQIRPLLLKKP
jgi:lysophospholipase L1-like esterase